MENQSERVRWARVTIVDYVDPEYAPLWAACPHCLRRPRIWVFDNGRYAKCQCLLHSDHYPSISGSAYVAAEVEAISIGEFLRRSGGSAAGYDPDLLRRLWNTHVEEEQGHTP